MITAAASALLLFSAGEVLADSATLKSTSLLSPTYYTGVVARGSAGGVISINTERSVSHSRSGSVGVSWSIINGAAGFTVTESISVTYSYTRSAPSSSYCYKISAHDRWKQYVIDWHHVGWGPLPNGAGTFIVKRHNGVSYSAPAPYRVPTSGRCS